MIIKPKTRKAIELLYKGKFKPYEIAELLDLPKVTVISYIRLKKVV